MPPECVILIAHLSVGAAEIGVGSGMDGWLGSGVVDGAQPEIRIPNKSTIETRIRIFFIFLYFSIARAKREEKDFVPQDL
jgi:hypothetical protein